MSEGRKDDTGKLRWGLLRKSLVVPLEAIIRVLMGGAAKYGDENWQKVENPIVRYRDALDRHLADMDKGIMIDKDSGQHNMAHVATNALFLLWFYLVGLTQTTEREKQKASVDEPDDLDDCLPARYKKPKPAYTRNKLPEVPSWLVDPYGPNGR